MQQFASRNNSKLMTSVLAAQKARQSIQPGGSSAAIKDVKKSLLVPAYSARASHLGNQAANKRGTQSQLQQQPPVRPRAAQAQQVNQKSGLSARKQNQQSQMEQKMRPFPQMETSSDQKQPRQATQSSQKFSKRSSSQASLRQGAYTSRFPRLQQQKPKNQQESSQNESNQNGSSPKRKPKSRERCSNPRAGSGTRSLLKSASTNKMNTISHPAAALKGGEGNVEYEKTPNKAIDQSNHKAKQNQFNKLKSVMKNQNNKDYKLVRPPRASSNADQNTVLMTSNLSQEAREQRDLDNEDIERAASAYRLEVPGESRKIGCRPSSRGSREGRRPEAQQSYGNSLHGTISSDIDRERGQALTPLTNAECKPLPEPQPAVRQETQEQEPLPPAVSDRINEEVEPSPHPYPSLHPSPDAAQRLRQLASLAVRATQNASPSHDMAEASSPNQASLRSAGRRPRNQRKQGTSRSGSALGISQDQAEWRLSILDNEPPDGLQPAVQGGDVDDPFDQKLKQKFSTASSVSPEPIEQSEVPQPLLMNAMMSEPPVLDSEDQSQQHQDQYQDEDNDEDQQQSPRIVDDIDLKGIDMPDLLESQQPGDKKRKLEAKKRMQTKVNEYHGQKMAPSNGQNTGSKSISNLLNQRINLSKSNIKNQWLNDLKISKSDEPHANQNEMINSVPCFKDRTESRYSAMNKDKLKKIEQEIQATRMSLLQADQKRKVIREQVLAAQSEREENRQVVAGRSVDSPELGPLPRERQMTQAYSIKFELKPTALLEDSSSEDQRNSSRNQANANLDQLSKSRDEPQKDTEHEGQDGHDKMQELLQKHTDAIGIDTIEESDANFEQTQKLNKKLLNRIGGSTRTDYKDQENLLMIYNNGKRMSKQDQKLFKMSKQKLQNTADLGLKPQRQKKDAPSFKSTSFFSKHQRSNSTMLIADKAKAPLGLRQPTSQRNNLKYDSGQIMPKKLQNQAPQAAGYPSLRSVRSVFGQKPERSGSNRSSDHQRAHGLYRGNAQSQRYTLTESETINHTINQELQKSTTQNHALTDGRADTDNIAPRFNTINAAGNHDNQVTQGSCPSIQSKNQPQPVKSSAAGLTMQDLIHEYQNRMGFYKDFYHSVKSYSNFDSGKAYQEFLERKTEQVQSKVDAVEQVVGQDIGCTQLGTPADDAASPQALKILSQTKRTENADQAHVDPESQAIPLPEPSQVGQEADRSSSQRSGTLQNTQNSIAASSRAEASDNQHKESKKEHEGLIEKHRRKPSGHIPAKAVPQQLARRRPVPQSSQFFKPGQQTILQTYRSSRRSFDFGHQGYQSVLKSKGGQQNASRQKILQTSQNNSKFDDDEKRIEAFSHEFRKALADLNKPKLTDNCLEFEQFREVMQILGFIKAGLAQQQDEQAEQELSGLFYFLYNDKEASQDQITTQALSEALTILCGLKHDPENLVSMFGKLSKNRKQAGFERGVHQAVNIVSKAYDGSRFKQTPLVGAITEQREEEQPADQPPNYKGVGLGVAGARPPSGQHKTKTPDSSAQKSAQKSMDHAANNMIVQVEPFPQLFDIIEAHGTKFQGPENTDGIKKASEDTQRATAAALHPYYQQAHKVSVSEFEKNKYESDLNSESALTAEQTEKQNRSEQLLERLVQNDRRPGNDPYAPEKPGTTKKSGLLAELHQSLIQQDASPARTFQGENPTSSVAQLATDRLQEVHFKTPTMQSISPEPAEQKMRIDYDISQLGNALIETSLKALGSPYAQHTSKLNEDAALEQSFTPAESQPTQRQPQYAQQVEVDDDAGLQATPQTPLVRAQSSQKLGASMEDNYDDPNQEEYSKQQQSDAYLDNQQDQEERLQQAAHQIEVQDSLQHPQDSGVNRPSSQEGNSLDKERTVRSPVQQAGFDAEQTEKAAHESTTQMMDVTDLDNEDDTMLEDPILILDIKLVRDEPQKITIYEFDNPEDIVDQFCEKHNLDDIKKQRLLTVITAQIQEYYAEQQEELTSRDVTGDNTDQDQEDQGTPRSGHQRDGRGSGQPGQDPAACMALGQGPGQAGRMQTEDDETDNRHDDREDALTQIDENVNETENTLDEDTLQNDLTNQSQIMNQNNITQNTQN